jgi:hypothetical protein
MSTTIQLNYSNPYSKTGGLFAQTKNSVAITDTDDEESLINTESSIGSLLVPADGFQVGDSFRAYFTGHLSCVGSATLRIRVKTILGVLLADTGVMALSAATNKHWNLDVNFTIRVLGNDGKGSIASGGLFSYTRNGGLDFKGINFSIVNDSTFDTTVNNELVVTAQWNAATEDDSIFSEIFTLTKTY